MINDKNIAELFDFLKKNSVECRKCWYPLHTQKPFKSYKKFKNSEKIYNRVLWLPSSLTLKLDHIVHICDLIKKYYRATA